MIRICRAGGQIGSACQYTDPNTGLIYLRARWYDPTTGQFLTRDPLQAITGQAYSHANDNPINGTDPSGLLCLGSVCLGFHPLAGLEGGVNVLAGFANAAVSTLTFGNVTIPQPFCGWGQNWAYSPGGITAGIESGFAAGAGGASGTRGLLSGLAVGGVKVASIAAPLAGGVAGSLAGSVVTGQVPNAGTVGKGAVGGLAGELGTGFFPGTYATGVSGGIGSVVGLIW